MTSAETPACPVCSLRETEYHSSGGDYLSTSGRRFPLVRCKGCGLVFLDAGKTPQEGTALYQDTYYREMRGISKILETWFLQERRRFAEAHIKTRGALLDLGCGTGEFVAAMRKASWEASGVEPSLTAGGKSDAADKISHSDLLALKFPAGNFSAVTLWQVLEHLPEPGLYLKEINRILAKDGTLVVSVPNINSLQARAGGGKWFHLDVPRHIWHFNPETVSKLLAGAGFRVKEIKHFSLEYNPFGWWQSLFNLLGCETNFAYKYLKRGTVDAEYSVPRRAYTLLCTALLALPLLPAAFLLCFLESAFRRGGVITLAAEKQ